MNVIKFVNSTTNIRIAEFISLTVTPINTGVNTATSVTVNMSSSYRREVLDVTNSQGSTQTIAFESLGGLLSLGEYHRDLQSSSNDTSVALDGVSPTVYNQGIMTGVGLVLNYNVKGSPLTIWRGFYDEQGNLLSYQDAQGRTRQLVQRFYGVVTTYTITENADNLNKYYSVVLNCSSIKTILSNNIRCRRTNHDDFLNETAGYMYKDQANKWQLGSTKTTSTVYDTCMDNVAPLNNAYFDFGNPPPGG